MKRTNWLYFLGDNDNKEEVFLYGLSLPTKFPTERNSKPRSIGSLGRGKKIYLYESIKDIEDIREGERLKLNKINAHLKNDLNCIYQKQVKQIPQHYIIDTPESPVNSIVKMDIFYTDYFYAYKNGKYLQEENVPELKSILKILQNNTGQRFSAAYSKRLGCFEYGSVMPWAESITPFGLDCENDKYYITRKNVDKDMFVHFIEYSLSGEVLLDEFKHIPKGAKEIAFDQQMKDAASYEYWVFNKDGELLHKDKAIWMSGINIGINLVTGTTDIKDKISKRDQTAKKVTTQKLASGVNVSFLKDKAGETLWNRENVIYGLVKKESQDKGKWFSKGPSQQLVSEIIKYFNQLTRASTELLIVDPYMSKETLGPLIRMENADLKINIISCLGDTNPDTGDNDIDYKKSIADKLNDLRDFGLPASYLTWHDLKEKSFHDRFIIIRSYAVGCSKQQNGLLK